MVITFSVKLKTVRENARSSMKTMIFHEFLRIMASLAEIGSPQDHGLGPEAP